MSVDDTALVASFCSLGGNCEFGVAQRAYGAEPFDLFRWASTLMPVLLNLLKHRFEGIGESLDVVLTKPGGTYLVRNARYRFRWHAWVIDGETTPERILVRVPDNHVSERGLPELVGPLGTYGPTTLLFVALADADHPPGTAVRVSDGLVRAYIYHFANPARLWVTTPSADWLTLCRRFACYSRCSIREVIPVGAACVRQDHDRRLVV